MRLHSVASSPYSANPFHPPGIPVHTVVYADERFFEVADVWRSVGLDILIRLEIPLRPAGLLPASI